MRPVGGHCNISARPRFSCKVRFFLASRCCRELNKLLNCIVLCGGYFMHVGSGWSLTCVAFQNGEVKRLLPSTSLSESPWASASTLLASLVRVTTLAVLVINSVAVQAFGSPACQLGSNSGFW